MLGKNYHSILSHMYFVRYAILTLVQLYSIVEKDNEIINACSNQAERNHTFFDRKYCWSDSYSVIYEDSLGASTYYQNIPNHDGWHAIDGNDATSFRLALGYGVEWYSIDTIKLRLATLASLCKTKCQDVYEKTRYPGGMCPPVSPTDYFRGYRYGYPYGFTTSNQQTCFRYYTGYNEDFELVYSEDRYCWTNSSQYLALEFNAHTESRGLYSACFPVHEEGCADCFRGWHHANPKDGVPVRDSCGEPCQNMYQGHMYYDYWW